MGNGMSILEAKRLSFRLAGALLAAATAAAAFYYGQALYGYQLLEKYPPDFSAVGWAKSGASLLAAFLIYLAVRPMHGQTRALLADLPSSAALGWAPTASAALLTFAAAGLVFFPKDFYPLVTDGAIGQTIGELLLLGAIVFAVLGALRSRHVAAARIGPLPGPTAFVAMAVTTILILGEEMSWGQHMFGWSTPEQFAGNVQNETNIHNFYTYRFETAYYLSAFVLFVVLPFAWPHRPGSLLATVGFYAPPAGFLLVAAPVFGPFYEYWNVVPMQIAFALGVLILLGTALDRERGTRGLRLMAAIWAVAMVAVQALALRFGANLSEGHELSEVRELTISLLMFLYLLWLWRKTVRAAGQG